MAEKEQAVPYPTILDGFGIQLQGLIGALQRDSLKPAIMADVRKSVELIHAIQQLMVMMYNIYVTNYEIQMRKIVDVETKAADLETRLAGYSESLNGLRADINRRIEAESGLRARVGILEKDKKE